MKGMYEENDERSPVNFYGKTKVEAEDAVMEYEYEWAIARTVLVYGKPLDGGSNIVTVVKDKLQKGEEYRLVTDQVRTPTFVGDLAKGIAEILERRAAGIYHLSGKDVLTPYDIGEKIADQLKLDRSLLQPVNATTFSQPAKRPPKTGFNIDKARWKLGFEPLSFEEGLRLSL
jgi:dTDP-4-dehydrorhamnose reductase